MPTKHKHKPRWNYRNSGGGRLYYFTDADFNQIAAAIKVPKLRKETRRQIEEATQNYFILKKLLDERPRQTEIKAALEQLIQKAEPLADLLQKLDDVTIDKMTAATLGRPYTKVADTIERCQKDVTTICQIAKKTKENINFSEQSHPKKSGAKGGHPRTRTALR